MNLHDAPGAARRWAFVLLGTAVQPSRLGTIAIEIAAAQSSNDLSRSRNIQAKSLLKIFFLAIDA
ncbi:MAG TPA: hypothetical protein VK632_03995, partial [Verrucomicrobiae bacterium]|nr:hypothetical protein [Verrucomicrobiae bacterium]